jgi:hypothetical protein
MTVQPDLPRPDLSRNPAWREVLQPGGPWSPLVVTGSSPDRVSRHADGLVLLAAPYLARLRDTWRYEQSVRASVMASIEMARLAGCGVTAVAPALLIAEIAHARTLVEDAPDPLDHRLWSDWARPLQVAARLVVVPAIDGWDRCPLVWDSVRMALARNKAVHVYGPA